MWYTYRNLAGNSGVWEYRFDELLYTWIEVRFQDGATYLYTDDSCSWVEVIEMIDCAERGIYLQRFINDHQPGYADYTK